MLVMKHTLYQDTWLYGIYINMLSYMRKLVFLEVLHKM